ncbi:putative aminoacid ABC-transporter permease [Candidatus Fokinia solitaria]|uniref:Putative glutamine transport system permease protein GlnP n=1 Tax=Candidatus Fokinia solitaria TaxID=1802984 RepID=A0A2U8BT00_9RICK|nr:amino acid ABC transporter permease [Candidatus Fokinia solitaria]AWD33428.1 putative aminoacid ABC-transporter permease [Candidatus Fokinia solitaria]
MSDEFLPKILFIGTGALLTLKLLFVSFTIGLFLGTLLAILRFNGILSRSIGAFVSFVRGSPMILQLSFMYFVVPQVTGLSMEAESAGFITLGINSAAYIAEIVRAGIKSIPSGQFEASIALQIPVLPMWKDIILPQVFRNTFPAFTNEIITLLKETALVATLGGMEIMRRAQIVGAEEFSYFWPLITAGLYYYALVLLIELLCKKIEGKLF